MDVCGTVVKQFGTCLEWLSVELDLNLFSVVWTCVQLRLSSFSVSCALSLCLVLQCSWNLLDLWGFEIGLSWKAMQTLATGMDGSTSGALEIYQKYLG